MRDQLRNIPQLRTLLALEAVARLGTFTAAAKELHMSQAAISQKIKELELRLGAELVQRTRPTITVTEEGKRVAESVRTGLMIINQSLRSVGRGGDDRRVTLATENSMALYWFGPRSQTFYSEHPDVELNLVSSDQVIVDGQINFDLGFTYLSEPPTSLRHKRLFDDTVVAVASPEYLSSRQRSLPPGQCDGDTLLRMDPEPWLTWEKWFEQVGLENRAGKLRADFFSNYITLMQSVLAGRGLALGWMTHVKPFIDSGKLIQLGDYSCKSPGAYYLVWDSPIGTGSPAAVRKLFEWFNRHIEPAK